MTLIQETLDFVKRKIEEFVTIKEGDNKHYVLRKNIGDTALDEGGAYFGIISPREDNSGPFHDLSIVIFPSTSNTNWVLSLGIGSLGFKDDYDVASTPGVRRLFKKLISEDGFCKTDFTDLETKLPNSFLTKVPELKDTLSRYLKVLPVCEILDDPSSENSRQKIEAFLAAYAKIRNWASNDRQRKALTKALELFTNKEGDNEEDDAKKLLLNRKYIILQGPPGTGKTRLAKILVENLKAKYFLTQFYPDVSYSDFVTGIRPAINRDTLLYQQHEGLLIKAIKEAKASEQKVILIIDEINRGNLSSILGPLFYLLEYNRNKNEYSFLLPDGTSINELPSNLYIIGTMNTTDRSLAVVDIAMRRRFAWFNLKPKSIEGNNEFFKNDFNEFENIFQWYASSNEMPFQPGQAYFLAKDESEIKQRIEYELMPLIKEYLNEGIMVKAKDEFDTYFINRIGKSLFE